VKCPVVIKSSALDISTLGGIPIGLTGASRSTLFCIVLVTFVSGGTLTSLIGNELRGY